jgi:hypothetical protein
MNALRLQGEEHVSKSKHFANEGISVFPEQQCVIGLEVSPSVKHASLTMKCIRAIIEAALLEDLGSQLKRYMAGEKINLRCSIFGTSLPFAIGQDSS